MLPFYWFTLYGTCHHVSFLNVFTLYLKSICFPYLFKLYYFAILFSKTNVWQSFRVVLASVFGFIFSSWSSCVWLILSSFLDSGSRQASSSNATISAKPSFSLVCSVFLGTSYCLCHLVLLQCISCCSHLGCYRPFQTPVLFPLPFLYPIVFNIISIFVRFVIRCWF